GSHGTFLLFTRKGLSSVFAPVSWLGEFEVGTSPAPTAFPCVSTVVDGRTRSQLRGSAGLAPASLSVASATNARTYKVAKERPEELSTGNIEFREKALESQTTEDRRQEVTSTRRRWIRPQRGRALVRPAFGRDSPGDLRWTYRVAQRSVQTSERAHV